MNSRPLLTLSRIVLVLTVIGVKAGSQIVPATTIAAADGLLSNAVNVIMQDSRGFLWIGTGEGISVYDGATFRHYTVADGLAANLVVTLLEDPNQPGRIWSGFLGGDLCELTGSSFIRHTPPAEWGAIGIHFLHQEAGEPLWLGTSHGLLQFSNGSFRQMFPEDVRFKVLAFVHEGDSVFWMVDTRSLYMYLSNSRRLLRINVSTDTTVQHFSSSLFRDRSGNIWTGMTDGTICLVNDSTILARQRITDAAITSFTQDQSGTLIVTTTRGLFSFTAEEFIEGTIDDHRLNTGLASTFLTCALVDAESNLWVGTAANGMARLSSTRNILFPLKGIPRNSNNAIATIDANDHLWVTSRTGVHEFWRDSLGRWNGKAFTLAQATGSPICVRYDTDSSLWILLNDGSLVQYTVGIRRYQPSQLSLKRMFKPGRDFPKGVPYFFILCRKNLLAYSCADRGVFLLDRTSARPLLRIIDTTNGLPGVGVRSLYEDTAGNLWFGMNHEGLGFLSAESLLTGRAHVYTTKDGLAENGVRAIMQTSDGMFWIGTRSGGLSLFDGRTFTTYNMRNGLPSNSIWSITVDANSTLWFGTSSGLLVSRQRRPYRFIWYEQSILRDHILMTGILRDGTIACVSPEAVLLSEPPPFETAKPPPVYITDIQVNGTPAPVNMPLRFSHEQNTVSISFVGVSFRDGGIWEYQYRLDHPGHSWQSLAKQTSLTLTALEPGEYRVLVRAMTVDGTPSELPASVDFVIVPPFWKRWWFIPGVVFLAVSAVFGVIRHFEKQKMIRHLAALEREQAVRNERERTRERIARDLHDDISATLSGIVSFASATQGELRQTPSGAANKFLSLIQESAAAAQESLSDIVWSITPENDSWEHLFAKLRRYASDMFESQTIAYEIEVPRDCPLRTLTMDERRNFWLLFKETVTNIVRHSRCTQATVLVRVELPNRIRMKIADNGKGFDSSQLSMRHGLKNIRNRAALLGGEITLDTSPGKGTRWEFTCTF